MEMLTKKDAIKGIKNPSLMIATNRIFAIGDRIRRGSFEVAAIVASVEQAKMYADDFKSGAEWARAVFGFNKSTFYNMCKVGSTFLSVHAEDVKGVRVVNYHSALVKWGEEDYNTTQLVQLLPIGIEVAVELHEHAVIRPDMTVKEIKEAVTAYRQEAEEAKEKEAEEVEAEEVEVLERYTQTAQVVFDVAEKKVTVTIGQMVYVFDMDEWAEHTNVTETVKKK